MIVLQVGAATETELKDKKLRYEDALNSVKSALEMGVVPGGGACMLYMSCDAELKADILAGCNQADEDEKLGVEIMFRSLPAPMKQIAKNAGLEGEVHISFTYILNYNSTPELFWVVTNPHNCHTV
jgi:chaperonin GroEL